ncbi:MAG: hypothetical protein R3213_10170 [Flavobacteriaceae bacterium]|nr:hypothetical protein [Flavobacteriaceae bacterium]
MKKILLGLVFLSVSSLCISQTQIAATTKKVDKITTPTEKSSNFKVENNSSFTTFFKNDDLPFAISSLYKQVAEYDVKESPRYSISDPSEYTIGFSSGANKIEAIYGQDGNIKKCHGNFREVSLPYKISSKLAQEFEGWQFKRTSARSTFLDGQHEIVYKVILKKDNKIQTVKINDEGEIK